MDHHSVSFLFLVVVATASAGSMQPQQAQRADLIELNKVFSEWKLTFNKTYDNVTAEAKAFSTFVANEALISAHNANANASFMMGLNQFSDLTASEFKAQWAGYDAAAAAKELRMLPEHKPAEDQVLPLEIHHVGCSSDVKNQGSCGSCWSFSTTGAIEAQLCGPTLSEQDLVSCDKQSNGCNGGSMAQAFSWISKNGIASESNYPYTASDSACNAVKERQTVAKVSGGRAVYGEDSLKSAVATRAVSIAVAAVPCVQHYQGGVIDEADCGQQLDHGVLAVGYGMDGGKNYWRIKNSWGAGWGEGGYFRVVAGKKMLGIGSQAVYPTGVQSATPSPSPPTPPGPPSPPGPGPTCSDTPPPQSADSCANQKEWGKCGRSWMKGHCCKTCFNCHNCS
jgi:hypothetical protein